jgi:Transposase IS116/IS110/IS902 family
MTVPGVNLIAARHVPGRGRRHRMFRNSRKLVAYLGLDPRVRQSGEQPARSRSIPKRASVSARWALVEATWSVVNQPGPVRAFYQRVKARRGHGKAIVAAARKLAVLFWCMLTRGPGLRPPAAVTDRAEAPAARDRRRCPRPQGRALRRVGHPPADATCREATRRPGTGLIRAHRPRLASLSAEEEGSGREHDTGARIVKSLKRGQAARQTTKLLTSALRFVSHPRPATT